MAQRSGTRAARRDAVALVAAAAREDVDTRLRIVSAYCDDGTLDRLVPLWDALAEVANAALTGRMPTGGPPGGGLAEAYLADRPFSADAFAAFDALAFLDAHRAGDTARLALLRAAHLAGPRRAARLTARLIGLAREAVCGRSAPPADVS